MFWRVRAPSPGGQSHPYIRVMYSRFLHQSIIARSSYDSSAYAPIINFIIYVMCSSHTGCAYVLLSPGKMPQLRKKPPRVGRSYLWDNLSRSPDLYKSVRIVKVIVVEDVLVLAYERIAYTHALHNFLIALF